MKITVKFYGRYQEIIGKQELEIRMDEGSTIWNIVESLIKKYPNLEKDKKFIMVSQNNTFTTVEAKIKNGDEITLSPPIVGGG